MEYADRAYLVMVLVIAALNRCSGGIYMLHAEDHVGFTCALV